MIISKEYGPQIDPSDGTCGEIQLVRRYCLVAGEGRGQIWTARQGSYTHASIKKAMHAIKQIRANNNSSLYPADLRPAPYWCWPKHFDPAYPIE